MLGLMAWYGYAPPVQVLLLPVFLMLVLAAALGVGLWLSALTVKYRDFRYIVPFIAQFGLYVSPVGFSTDVVPASWRLAYALNPMTGIIEGFRWAILGTDSSLARAGGIAGRDGGPPGERVLVLPGDGAAVRGHDLRIDSGNVPLPGPPVS